ncbi:helix-turn-helix transcriptional regulator [Myroides albus]|uniref:Transcriptional regulator n=1 Tax=Myroides albus TaxID=2562892 RepID=A0A6I3LS89_9FLAO|nr:helix-turn-helix domain-containing protein [Myroides albus]MTG98855.1 transcriptional regulator [Myroides albus]UVD80448.1 helix-turn-helix transcriptional regulator [Myroides albus]
MAKRKENSTNNINREYITTNCDAIYTICKIGGRWKMMILFYLEEYGTLRFNELKEKTVGITDRMLSLQLKELEADNLVTRQVYAEVPPRVEYSLTNIAKDLLPIWPALEDWGTKHRALSAVKQEDSK